MPPATELLEAAIRLDQKVLIKSDDAGALHFLGILSLDPRHIGDARQGHEVVLTAAGTSVLFVAAESIKTALHGDSDGARAVLADWKPQSDLEQLIVLLVQAWLDTASSSLTRVDEFIRQTTFSRDISARSYLKLMTWALERGGTLAARPYYDLALEYSSGQLSQAIHSVGSAFGADARIYFKPPTSELVSYSSITDSVYETAYDQFYRDARRQFTSPFTRTWGADPHTNPIRLRAAELQAGWTGAYWALQKVWRLKASILLINSDQPVERADAIAAWALSGGARPGSLVDANEQYLTEELIAKIFREDLKSGNRISESDWVGMCSAIWDELPNDLIISLIDTLRVERTSEDALLFDITDAPTRLFASLSRADSKTWLDRFRDLDPEEQLSVALTLNVSEATALPASARYSLRRMLLEVLERTAERGNTYNFPNLTTLAALLLDEDPGSSDIARFQQLLPHSRAAEVAALAAAIVPEPLLEECLIAGKQELKDQLAENRAGRWTKRIDSIPLQIAQCMVSLKRIDESAIRLIVDLANSPFTSSDDIIDAIASLSWLVDTEILSPNHPDLGAISFKTNLSPIDRYWTGRDDLRAINASIAGLLARLPVSRVDAMNSLIVSTRDPDINVRLYAVSQLASAALSVEGLETAVDAALLGAVFDPDSRVQAAAVRGIPLISDNSVRRLAWERVVREWEISHRRVRVAAARTLARTSSEDPSGNLRDQILGLAESDRSLNVRAAVRNE
ncbi:hypothetical protein [Mycobacterium sp. PSTR-4-N]|uniref:HEAT repeat domain-containing protein n=1 Tax=Mycobacterium sp. PSTR-4-N TaxID=2917745 RepID=UPI001F156814|nr:hypothetical protein [Mycobacterium sp. PSTR-4-N]MCG7595551.1 hypothetical protein [Mycobacterium sp. PSTR-4-N]